MRIVLSVIQYLGTKVNKKFIPGIIKSFIKYMWNEWVGGKRKIFKNEI